MPLLQPLHADREDRLPFDPAPGQPTTGLTTIGLLAGAVLLLLDQQTKELAASLLVPPGRRVELPGPFTLQLTFNDGGAFGFPAPSWVFIVVTVVVFFIVVYNLPRVARLDAAIAYGLLLAGALGNGFDRVFRPGDPGDPRFLHGHVVDFIASARFPTFNVADIAITAGFSLLMLAMFLEERAGTAPQPRARAVADRG